MAEAGYRLIVTYDVVRGYWFGRFEIAPAGGYITTDIA
jgi:hypothetical protein